MLDKPVDMGAWGRFIPGKFKAELAVRLPFVLTGAGRGVGTGRMMIGGPARRRTVESGDIGEGPAHRQWNMITLRQCYSTSKGRPGALST